MLDLDLFQLIKVCELLNYYKNIDDLINKIVVNVLINYLLQVFMVNQMINVIEILGIMFSQLVFEFDENDLNCCFQFIFFVIKKLKCVGVILVLDNFGSGLVLLSYLFVYFFDFIKIDYCFVKLLFCF